MSTTTQKLKYLWTAVFADGHRIAQPEDDRYSKYDDTAEWNPSAFRDVLDYEETSPLSIFILEDKDVSLSGVGLENGLFSVNGHMFTLEETPLTNRKLIFFREIRQEFQMSGETGEPYVNRYAIGYEGKDENGKVHKKIIYIA